MEKISVKVCLGTTCFVMGSANLQELMEIVPAKYGDKVDVCGVPLPWIMFCRLGIFKKLLM